MILSPQLRIWLTGGALVLSAAAGAYFNGLRWETRLASAQRDWAIAEKARLDVAVAKQAQQSAGNERVKTEFIKGDDIIRVEYRTLTKEVIRYVTDKTVDHCLLPARWVQLHDSAATGLPAPASAGSGVDAATGTVTDADALPVVTDNYKAYREVANQLQGLQAYVNEVCRK